MDLIAVDPGVHACGVAWFKDSHLFRVEYRSDQLPWSAFHCVCELPEQRGRSTNVRMSDIIDLALSAGRMTGAYSDCEYRTPSQWKGQMPKSVQHRRMWKALGLSEVELLLSLGLAKGLLHNVYDAVSLGLVALGRM